MWILQPFRPYFASMMQQAFAGIDLGSARLKECSFLFFGVMARVFEDEFAPYLSRVVPALFASLKQAEHGDEEIVPADAVASFASGSTPATAISVGADGLDAEDIDVDIDKLLDVNSTMPTDRINHRRAWRTSEILPFLGHVGIERLECSSAFVNSTEEDNGAESLLDVGSFARVLVNGAPIPIPDCQDGPGDSCSLAGFTEYIQARAGLYGDFVGACGINETVTNRTDTLTIYSDGGPTANVTNANATALLV